MKPVPKGYEICDCEHGRRRLDGRDDLDGFRPDIFCALCDGTGLRKLRLPRSTAEAGAKVHEQSCPLCDGRLSPGACAALTALPTTDEELAKLLAHLRAERDRAEMLKQEELARLPNETVLRNDFSSWSHHHGRAAALDQAILSIVRWSRGENPDPSLRVAGTPDELLAHLAALRSGELPAGATLPTTDEELAKLREQVAKMTDDIVAELHYLRWFREAASAKLAALIAAGYTPDTGRPVPDKWR